MKKWIIVMALTAVFLFVLTINSALGEKITCEIDGPNEAEIGKNITVSYKLTGGSGKYSNAYFSINSMFGDKTIFSFLECVH